MASEDYETTSGSLPGAEELIEKSEVELIQIHEDARYAVKLNAVVSAKEMERLRGLRDNK